MKALITFFVVTSAICIPAGVWMISDGEILGYLEILVGCFGLFIVYCCVSATKEQKEKALRQQEALNAELAEKQRRTDTLNKNVKEGKWIFPAEKLYQLCYDSHATILDNEFSIRKATQIAEQVIKDTAPEIDLANCGEYLKKESLEAFLKKGQILAEEAEERKVLAQKQPQNANPNVPEKTFIKRASELTWLSGCDKRVKMLTNLISDYDDKIMAMREGEEALKQLGMIYASQQKKETSWAIMGGIAEGIAGPAAGVMAASNTIANNRRIQQYNESVRKASMDIMSGIPSVAGDRYKLEEEREKINQKLDEAKNKVVLFNPVAKEIWENIKVGKAEVMKNPSGVLSVSVPVSLKEPFTLDVPDNVRMVVDGVIRAEVWFEDKRVDFVYFPLPIYGIPHNMTATITLDGMCGRSVEYDGEYTVKIGDYHNLWIMEA